MTNHEHNHDSTDLDVDRIVGDVDEEENERPDEMLEGLLGQGASDRDDVPTRSPDVEEDDLQDDRPTLDADVVGRWTCRFCERTSRHPEREDGHHEDCRDSRIHWAKLGADEDDPDDDDLEDDLVEPDREGRYFIDPQWHEFSAYLKFDDHGLSPFFAFHQLMRRTDWHDGAREFTVDFDGRSYHGEFTYQESGLEPRDDESFSIEKVREFRIKLRTADGIRKAAFKIAPRWPDMESKGDAPTPNNPREMLGVDVETKGSNHDPRDYPQLLEAAADALGVNGSSKRYFAPGRVKPWSVITDGELYVRIDEAVSGKLIGVTGPIERMGLLLASDRDGYRKHVADDRECSGYYHTATFGSMRARRLVDGHRLGKEVKHYHMRAPDAQTGATKHPKLGVSFQRSTSEEPVYWGDADALLRDDIIADDALTLDDMTRELDEVLLNTLRWAGLPTRPDHQVFVEDAVFKIDADSRERALVADPLPTLEIEQEHMVTRALNRMTDLEQSETDAQVVTELLADGGEVSPDELADRTGRHYSTILRSLKRLGDVVEHRYGEVGLKSHHIAQQLAERAGALLENFGRVQEGIDRIGGQIANAVAGLDASGESAFELWAKKHLDGVDDPDDDARIVLRMGYRPDDGRELRSILEDAYSALVQTVGAHAARNSLLVRHGRVRARDANGAQLERPFVTG